MAKDPEEALARLRASHPFPGPFSFKAIGPNEPHFEQALRATIAQAAGSEVAIAVARRESAKGHHLALTASLRVQSAEQVLAIYAALQALPGLKMLL